MSGILLCTAVEGKSVEAYKGSACLSLSPPCGINPTANKASVVIQSDKLLSKSKALRYTSIGHSRALRPSTYLLIVGFQLFCPSLLHVFQKSRPCEAVVPLLAHKCILADHTCKTQSQKLESRLNNWGFCRLPCSFW